MGKRLAVLMFSILLGGVGWNGASFAQPPVPASPELLVNLFTPGSQLAPAVAMDAAGNFVVIWLSDPGNGDRDIRVRRYDSAGNPLIDGTLVNSFTLGNQADPAVDMNAAGSFVVTWHSNGQDGDDYGVFARRFASSGVALATEFQVNLTTIGRQDLPAVGLDDQGDFVIAWQSSDGSYTGIFGRRFASSGVAHATEFQINTTTASTQVIPDVDLDADGGFVVVWTSAHEPSFGVFGQRFSSTGVLLGLEFPLHSYVTNSQTDAHVGLDADGDFVAVWMSNQQDGSLGGIFGRRFSSAGTPRGAEFQVNDYATGYQHQPDIAVDRDGDFVVVWTTYEYPDKETLARRFKARGATEGPDLPVNTSSVGRQYLAAVDTDADGDFVVAWSSSHGGTLDVIGRLFDVAPQLDIDGDGVFDALTDGVLVLRFGFGFTGQTLITGAVGAGCTRCDAPSITSYLQTLL